MTRYCFDLDNTLCDTDGTDYENARPKWDRIGRVIDLHRGLGHEVFIYTARGDTVDDPERAAWIRRITRLQLDGWGLAGVEVRYKAHADVYVDDKSQQPEDFFNSIDIGIEPAPKYLTARGWSDDPRR